MLTIMKGYFIFLTSHYIIMLKPFFPSGLLRKYLAAHWDPILARNLHYWLSIIWFHLRYIYVTFQNCLPDFPRFITSWKTKCQVYKYNILSRYSTRKKCYWCRLKKNIDNGRNKESKTTYCWSDSRRQYHTGTCIVFYLRYEGPISMILKNVKFDIHEWY